MALRHARLSSLDDKLAQADAVREKKEKKDLDLLKIIKKKSRKN